MAESLALQMQNQENGEGDDITDTQMEYIASYAWNLARISVAYYNTTTCELYLAHEAVDLKPEFWHLKNLFRQLNQRAVLASGPPVFHQTIMTLLGIPQDESHVKYSVNRLKSSSRSKFLVYHNNDKTLLASQKRIYELNLSHMAHLKTPLERRYYIQTVIPMEQNLLVQALGNLLSYLDDNWKHMFLRTDQNPVISNVLVYHMDTQTLMDESSLFALQIFCEKDHPSGFIKSSGRMKRQDMSLFYLINKCASRMGTMELKILLQQPIRDIQELRSRHTTIEWFMNAENASLMGKLRQCLSNLLGLTEIFQKLVNGRNRVTLWKNFKSGLYYGINAGQVCQEIMERDGHVVGGTTIEALGKFSAETKTMEEVLMAINVIVDLDQSLRNNRFVVKFGVDAPLDEKKRQLKEVLNVMREEAGKELHTLPLCITEITVHYVAQVGFMLSIPLDNGISPEQISTVSSLRYIYRTGTSVFYNNELCAKLNASHGDLYVDISVIEDRICDALLDNIRNKLSDVQHICKLCARLDAFMSLATFALTHHLRKPVLVEQEKTLEILNGRHMLINQSVSNSTVVNVAKRNLINVLIAPNASGKSVYLKQVAQIVYLAHIGCFVPAEAARLSLMDAIYTRIYSPEYVSQGQSAFLVELQQMSYLLMNSSTNSMILIDEFGQGTADRDGRALVQSSLEHLNERGELAPFTFLSTHFTNMYDALQLAEWINFKTFSVVRNEQGALTSTFELMDGIAPDQYGRDCNEAQEFLRRTSKAVDTKHTGPNDNEDTGIVDNAETIYQMKIQCAADCVRAYVHNQQANDPCQKIDIAKLFRSYRISDDQPEPDNN